MAEYGLRSRSYYSTLPDAELDALTGNIMHEFPTVGYIRMTGLLRSRGQTVQREQIYGNHKLIRWRLVFHGGIDGYTRMIVFLACSNNNRAETVFTSFHGAVQQFGLPSRVRSDKGKENLDGSNDTDFAYSSNVFSRSRRNRTDVSRTRERPPSISQASINL
eukprot:gene8561-9477_t